MEIFVQKDEFPSDAFEFQGMKRTIVLGAEVT